MPEDTCLLCRAAAGELPARIFVAGERVLGLVNDLEPLSRGHVVFFPRRHAARLDLLEDAELAELVQWAARSARALGLEAYNLLQNNGALAGQTIFHAHLHLIPKWSEAEGLRYERPSRRRLDHGDAFATLEKAFGGAGGTGSPEEPAPSSSHSK